MIGYWAAVMIPILLNTIGTLGIYISSSSGRVSAGHAAYFGIGAYTAAIFSTKVVVGPGIDIALGFVVSAVLGGLFALVVARLDHWFFAVATLAFGLVVSGLAASVDFLGGAVGLSGVPVTLDLAGAIVWLLVVSVAAMLFDLSRAGQLARAVRQSPLSARAMGVRTGLVQVCTYAAGAGVTGLAGALYVHYIGFISPADVSFSLSLLFLVCLAVGGTEWWAGAVIGGIILGLLPELLRFSDSDRYTLYGALLVVVMIARPTGLLPRPRILAAELRSVQARFRSRRSARVLNTTLDE